LADYTVCSANLALLCVGVSGGRAHYTDIAFSSRVPSHHNP